MSLSKLDVKRLQGELNSNALKKQCNRPSVSYFHDLWEVAVKVENGQIQGEKQIHLDQLTVKSTEKLVGKKVNIWQSQISVSRIILETQR